MSISRISSQLCIGVQRGVNYGTVFDSAGESIGQVFPTSRRLRNTGGQFGRAWTALAFGPGGETIHVSLGTRHETRWSAARAIHAFRKAWHAGVYDAYSKSQAAAIFKYDNYELCGLTKRYRGADPRTV